MPNGNAGGRSVEQFQHLRAFMPASSLTIMWSRVGLPKDFATSFARARPALFIKFMNQVAFVVLAFARPGKTGPLMHTWVVKGARLDPQIGRR